MDSLKISTNRLAIIILMFLSIMNPTNAQDELSENTQDSMQVFVCIVTNNAAQNLIELQLTEPVGLIFSSLVNVIVYTHSDTDIVADVIHVTSDTISGTYRYVEDVVRGANTTSNFPRQGNCKDTYSEQLTDLDRTILMPLSPDQSLIIHSADMEIDYGNSEETLIIGAVGLLFPDSSARTGLPHLQILRFRGGEDDTVSIRFPDLQTETRAYMITTQRISYTNTDVEGHESPPYSLDFPIRFILRLNTRGEALIESVMAPGNFRIYVDRIGEVNYEPGGLLNISRLSSFLPRDFEAGDRVQPIDCSQDLPYFRLDDYTHYIYWDNTDLVVGHIRCTNPGTVEEVRDDGILIVDGGYAIAAWLVEPVE